MSENHTVDLYSIAEQTDMSVSCLESMRYDVFGICSWSVEDHKRIILLDFSRNPYV